MDEVSQYEINKRVAISVWNAEHPSQPAMYAQSIKFSDDMHWRISGYGGGVIGYVNLKNRGTMTQEEADAKRQK